MATTLALILRHFVWFLYWSCYLNDNKIVTVSSNAAKKLLDFYPMGPKSKLIETDGHIYEILHNGGIVIW